LHGEVAESCVLSAQSEFFSITEGHAELTLFVYSHQATILIAEDRRFVLSHQATIEQQIRIAEDRIQDRTDFSAVAHQVMELEQQVQVAFSVPSPACKVSFPTVLGCVVGN
jgi:hypothetical protein